MNTPDPLTPLVDSFANQLKMNIGGHLFGLVRTTEANRADLEMSIGLHVFLIKIGKIPSRVNSGFGQNTFALRYFYRTTVPVPCNIGIW